jgi:hypothetical protein
MKSLINVKLNFKIKPDLVKLPPTTLAAADAQSRTSRRTGRQYRTPDTRRTFEGHSKQLLLDVLDFTAQR